MDKLRVTARIILQKINYKNLVYLERGGGTIWLFYAGFMNTIFIRWRKNVEDFN